MNTARLPFFGAMATRRASRAEAESPEPDPAEMGTCFGLDLVLPHGEPAPAAEAPAGRQGWRRRFGWLGGQHGGTQGDGSD
jgi:hypothetical protein